MRSEKPEQPNIQGPIADAARQIKLASEAKKCWQCGCFHDTLKAIEKAMPEHERPAELASAIQAGKERLIPRKYDCLGCKVCFPVLAINALQESGSGPAIDPCAADEPQSRNGWPPLPGDYAALQYRAAVAVCTLNDVELAGRLAENGDGAISIVGTLRTENLGIERVITNILANPNIRFLILCGEDSRQAIGHLPGQSLLALARSGIDAQGKIVGAKGKRPVLKNIKPQAVEHFRKHIEVLNHVGIKDMHDILRQTRECVARNPGPAAHFPGAQTVPVIGGYLPDRMIPDPAGYFVVYADRLRRRLLLEHYQNNGVLDVVFEGQEAAELYVPAIEKGMISRLDHAAYLGRELARAQASLLAGKEFVQDGAPQRLHLGEKGAPCCGTDTCGKESA